VPHNLMPSQGSPGPSEKFHIAPILRLLISSGSKKGAQIKLIRNAPFPEPSFICLSKIPGKRTFLQVPQRGPLWTELPVSRAFFCISLEFLIKVLPVKETSPFSRRPYERSVPHVPQKGAPIKTDAHFPEPYLAYLAGSLVKEPSLRVPLTELPRREMPHS
jgi:hypothetical protein